MAASPVCERRLPDPEELFWQFAPSFRQLCDEMGKEFLPFAFRIKCTPKAPGCLGHRRWLLLLLLLKENVEGCCSMDLSKKCPAGS